MSQLYRRRWEILIDDKPLASGDEGRQFRIFFNVLQDFGSVHSYCDLTISNLSNDTSARALTRGSKLTLRCGYVDTVDTIFTGRIRNTFRHRSGTEINTQIIARGGALPEDGSVVNRSFGAGVKLTELIGACSAALGLPLVIIESQFADVAPYVGGYRMVGDPLHFLTALSRTHSFNFTVENDRLLVVRQGFSRGGQIELINQFTGMEGAPEITEAGATVVTRLAPQARIGGRFQIESRFTRFNFSNLYFQDVPETAGQGVYSTLRLQHSGDSHGDIWSTRREGVRPV